MKLFEITGELSGEQKLLVYAVYVYAKEVIGGRWPEAEPYVMRSQTWAFFYAKEVIGGRWPEAEPVIMKHPGAAYRYATDVIKGRWPEAEPYIKKDSLQWGEYRRGFKF